MGATASGVRRDEPDRSEFVQVDRARRRRARTCCAGWAAGAEGAVRTFSDLNENSHEYQAKYSIDFGAARAAPTTIRFGGLYRATGRDAQSDSYNISSMPAHGSAAGVAARADLRRALHAGRPACSTSARCRRAARTSRDDRLSAGF